MADTPGPYRAPTLENSRLPGSPSQETVVFLENNDCQMADVLLEGDGSELKEDSGSDHVLAAAHFAQRPSPNPLDAVLKIDDSTGQNSSPELIPDNNGIQKGTFGIQPMEAPSTILRNLLGQPSTTEPGTEHQPPLAKPVPIETKKIQKDLQLVDECLVHRRTTDLIQHLNGNTYLLNFLTADLRQRIQDCLSHSSTNLTDATNSGSNASEGTN